MHPPPPSPRGYPQHQPLVAHRGPEVGWAVGLWVIVGLSLSGTLLCVGFAAYGFWISHHMDGNGVTTPAVVTGVDGDDVTVDFTTEDGESVTAEIIWWPADVPATGEELMITYDPDDVTYAVADGSNEDRVLAIAFAVAAFVGLLATSGAAVGATLIHRARSRNSRAAAAPSPLFSGELSDRG